MIGLRGRFVAAMALVSAVTLGVTALALFSPLEQRLRSDVLDGMVRAVHADRRAFAHLGTDRLTASSMSLHRVVKSLRRGSGADVAVVGPDGRLLYSTDADDLRASPATLKALRTGQVQRGESGPSDERVAEIVVPLTVEGSRVAVALSRPLAALRFSGTDLVTIAKVPAGGAGALTGTIDPTAAGATSDACPAIAESDAVPLTPGERATILPDGRATSPATAPSEVKAIIAAGNQINGKPYVYGGCHGSLATVCANYDCSSAVSYLLYRARLHGPTASVSGDFDGWKQPGNGRWITTASNSGHIYLYVAGIRFDTHQYGARDNGPNKGIGWHPGRRPDSGFHLRHPPGL